MRLSWFLVILKKNRSGLWSIVILQHMINYTVHQRSTSYQKLILN